MRFLRLLCRDPLPALCLLALVCCAPPVRAAEAECSAEPAEARERAQECERPRLFEELLVVGSEAEALRVPGSAHVIGRRELERQEHSDVHRVLRRAPGVSIQEEDGYGLRPNIGIRGTGVERSQKVTLLEDGVLVAPAPYAAPSAYYAPTAGRMEGFEIRKGSGAIRQGPYTNGGAINYLSTGIPGALRARLQLAAGDDELRRAHATVGDSGPRVGWLFETYQLSTDGFKRLDGGGATGFELEDYLGKLRLTSRPGATLFQALELKLGKTRQEGDETYLGLTQSDFERDPYRRYASSAGDRIVTDHEQLQLSWYVDPAGPFDLTATLYRNDFFRNWHKLESVGGVGVAAVLAAPDLHPGRLAVLRGEADSAPGALAVRNNRRDYYSQGLQIVAGLDLGGRWGHELAIGVRAHEDGEDRFQEEDLYRMESGRRVFERFGAPGSQANRVADARALALFVEDTFTSGRWTWTPGVRVEAIELTRRDFGTADPLRTGASLSVRRNDLTEVIPGLGVGYRLSAATILFLGVHRGFSPPAPGSTEEVASEESVNYELGWRLDRGDLDAELVLFANDYDNLLGTDTTSGGGGGTGEQFNGGEARLQGLEAGFGVELARASGGALRLPLRLAYTYTDSEFRTSFLTGFADWAPRVERGDELPYLAEHQLFAGLGVEGGRWAVHLDAHYSDEMRTNAGRGPIPAGERIGSRLLLDVRAELELGAGFEVWGQLLNATDETYVAARRPAGLRPGRPRALLFGLSWDFPGRR